MKYPLIRLIVTLLVSLVLLVSVMEGCTKGTIAQPTPTVAQNSATPATSVVQKATAIKPGVHGGQGILNLADQGPITLDPALAADAGSASYVVQIFSGLVKMDTALNIVPDIAQSWDKSSDGKTYTFHLLHNVYFHDGNPVTAADFKYSWERALDPANQSLTASTYLNDIVGSADILSGKTKTISGVKIIDDYTLQVVIDAPKAYFLDKMGYPTAFVVEKSNVAIGSTWWQRPSGTGPFRLKTYQKDQTVVLERNPDYYGSKALLNQVVFKLFGGNPLQLYQQNNIDVTYVGADYMGLVTDPSNPVSNELQIYPELSLSYFGFNAAIPPFDDANVRQAFSYAVDKQKLVTLSAKNVVAVANGILPPGMPGYNANLTGLKFDPQKAKRLIAASKYGDVSKLPPIVITTSGWGNAISGVMGGIIEEWRRNLGVEVTVRQLEPEAFLYSLNREKNNLFDSGWIADYPDPQDFLDVLFRTGAQNNNGGYSNPQLDTLLDKASVEQDPAARMKLYQQAEQMIVQDAAMLPLFFGKNYLLVKSNVKNYTLSPVGFPLLSQVSIQK